MNKKQMIKNSQQSSNYLPYPFFKRRKKTSIYEDMFMQDFCTHFSIILGKRNEYRHFYNVDEVGGRLKALLEYDDYMFLEYDLDKLLMQNLSDMIKYGKSYVEVVKIFDENDNLVGIKFLSFRNNIQVHFGKRIYYLLKKFDGKMIKGKIDAENVIVFRIHELGYTKRYLKRLLKNLRGFDFSFIELSNDSKSGFEFDVYTKNKDYNLLKVGHKTRWLGRKYDNYFVNEPYLLFIRMEELKLKEAILEILLCKYNEKLNEIGKTYNFSGKLCFERRTTNYDVLHKDLMDGIKNCKDVSDEVFG